MWETGQVVEQRSVAFYSRAELEHFAGLELDALAIVLGAPVPELHAAVRRLARTCALAVSRWERSGPALAVFYAEQDRRSLVSLLNGAREGAAPAARLEGLIPTPMLTERVLEELSRQDSRTELAALLEAVGHPFAGRLESLESAWAARLRALARRGDSTLQRFVELRVGGESSVARLAALARQRARQDPESCAHVLATLWRIEAQTRDLARVLWGLAVGAPRELVMSEFVTP
jgi:vacuolar-type H+-ATPase subunit C/Vma6